jgi:hypothetical protein
VKDIKKKRCITQMGKSKRALLVGINYKGTKSELNGCINDVLQVKEFLLNNGYKEKFITVLTDETKVKPTRANILKHLLKLIVSGSNTLYFHYSGHGGQTKDLSNDELDGYDETLVPIDYYKSGMIIDDEIRGLLPSLSPKQHLTVVLDCCHSGSGMDLKWNLFEKFGGRRLVLIPDIHYSDTRGQVIMFSGCQDEQTSADAYISSKFQGAMTHAFLYCYPHCKNYETLIREIRRYLRENHYTQVPNLSSGKQFDLKQKIKI